MSQLPKVLLLIPHLGGGGAEQVAAMLAKSLPGRKYELHLGLVTQADPGLELLPPGATIHALGASRVRTAAFPLLRLVRRVKPDLILSGMAHLNFLVLFLRSLFPRRTRVLARQNGTVSAALQVGDQPGYTRLLFRLLYPRADRIICQTRAMAEDMVRELALSPDRTVVLPNPVDADEIRLQLLLNPSSWTGPGPHLLAVGRLAREKGFDLLLRALAAVRRDFPTADLIIAGAGPEEAALKAQRSALDLEAVVHFAGRLDPPFALFSGTSLFVLSSRHEGLPNALLEAAAAGLPLVALPASGGVVELLQGQPGAWLAPEISQDALASVLRQALAAIEPGQRFAHAFIEPFRCQRAVAAWEHLIDCTLAGRQP